MKRIVVLFVMTALFLPLSPASAAPAQRFADWTPLVGTSTDFTTTMSLSPRFPTATMTSDSRGGQVGVQSGASSWFGENTPPGERYGSSRNQEYLNLRPKVDNASSPSTTTYTFERATPLGWAFVLGDIDSDQVRVTATTAEGEPATADDLGFQSSFNLCGFPPRPSSCGSPTPTDAPTWDPGTTTLTGNDAARDTTGATGWFEPKVPLRTLTFDFTRRAGFPVYQTWFALRTQDVTGTVNVTGGSCDISGAQIELLGLLGNVIDSTTADDAGSYSFTGLAASPNYRVGIRGLPSSCLVVGPSSQIFDLSTGDAVADFAVREIVTASITGTVTTADGPVEGVEVTLTPADPGGTPRTTTTDVDGFYAFDENDSGDYTVSVTAPDGYTRGSVDLEPSIPDGSEDAVDDQDFTLVADPTISGTVRTAGTAGEPLAGVTVELRDSAGDVVERAVTTADGAYSFLRVPGDSTYTVAVPTPPAEYGVPPVQTVDIGTENSGNNDFALSRPGSVSGTVTNAAGDPAADVEVRVTGPDDFDETRTTDDAGSYAAGDLPPGTYTVAVDGLPPRTVTITEAGENVGAVDFVLNRPGSVSGTVTDASGDPVAGVEIQLTGPDGFEETPTTDDAGNYEARDLAPGTYTVEIDGLPPRTVTITGTGENVDGVDFVLPAVLEPSPSPSPPPSPSPSGPSTPTAPGTAAPPAGAAAALPDTGGPRVESLLVGVLMLVVGTLCVLRRRTL